MKEINQTPISIRTEIWEQSQKKRHSRYKILTKDLAFGLFILLLTCLSCFLGFSGISSFLLLLKVFFQIFIFPLQLCSQVYQNIPLHYNTIQNSQIFQIFHCNFQLLYEKYRNFIFNHYKMIINILQIFINERKNLENLILLSIFSCFGLIAIFFTSWKNKILGHNNEKSFNLTKFFILFAKKIMILVLRPIIILLILIKFVLIFFITVSINLISSCVPQMIRNVTHRLMNSSINLLLSLFKRISTVSCILYVICIIFGLLLNKLVNLNYINIHLENLRQFLKKILYDSQEIEKTKNIPQNCIYQLMKPSNFLYIFNVIIENIIKLAKMIFHTFEIR